MHASTERVSEALRNAGATGQVRELADSTRTARDAAAALGCAVGAIASSLVFAAGDEPVLIVTSGAHRVDTDRVARALGVPKLRRADPDLVRAATGFPIGGVSPVGLRSPVRILVDTTLAEHETVWAAAGTPRSVFSTTYDELLSLTGGTPAEVA
jgi:prolyl-tRNA editing enzyme YbaK/EbsC (Cys-tRNA(Pro) deacylase)